MFNFNSERNLILPLTNGTSVNYKLIKKNRKTLTLRITEDGLIVNAPLLMTQNKINYFLNKKINWIEKKLKLLINSPKKIIIKEGAIFKYLGQDIKIYLNFGKKDIFWKNKDSVILKFNDFSNQEKLKKEFLKWIKVCALEYFIKRTKEISTKYSLGPKAILISNAKTRWGACNNKKQVRLNWRLIQASPLVIDYVICHELAHLEFMNHSIKFWSKVEELCPKYKNYEKQLKENGFKLYSLD